MKKQLLLIAIVILIGLFYFISYLSSRDLLGWRLNLSLLKIKTNNYQSFGPNIAFKYPDIFEIDSDPDNRYGENYVVGIKLKTDNRTGCDIRKGGPDLDYSKPVGELADGVTSKIKEKAKDFKLLKEEKIKIANQDALKTSFSFLDPIGARVRLDEIHVRSEGINFIVICGAGEYQFSLFEKDFGVLYKSLTF